MNPEPSIGKVFDELLIESKVYANHRIFQIADKIKEISEGEVCYFNPACGQCKECSYPDSPCRFPQWKASTVESSGILLRPILEKYHFTRYVTQKGIALFGMVLFNTSKRSILPLNQKKILISFDENEIEGKEYMSEMIQSGMCQYQPEMITDSAFSAGSYSINKANKNDVCILTSNYSLTGTVLLNEIEKSGVPANLLILDCENHPVLMAWAEGNLSLSKIVRFIKDAERNINSRTLFIPGKIKTMYSELQTALPEWKIIVGSDEVSGLPGILQYYRKLF